ncbi:MAG: hypothetical protein RBT63_03130 [Bdellovibrionales bacterium]|jgi:hypothetical protein|nr:hypothetical protein [Bdellovibrionales bacterium]
MRFLTLALFISLGFVFQPERAFSLGSFADVQIETPGELLLGRVKQARVVIELKEPVTAFEVVARAEGRGVTLPLKRRWRFVKIQPGQVVEFSVPYQLTRGFNKGAIHLEMATYEPSKPNSRRPASRAARRQTAVLVLDAVADAASEPSAEP